MTLVVRSHARRSAIAIRDITAPAVLCFRCSYTFLKGRALALISNLGFEPGNNEQAIGLRLPK